MPARDKWDRFASKPTKDDTDKWAQFASKPAPVKSVPVGSISAEKPSSGPAESIERYAQQLINDLKHGTDITGVGAFFKKIGAQPLHAGQPEAVGDLLGSPLLGPARMVKGSAETSQSGKLWKGTKDIVGGAAETVELPSLFMAPEATGAAGKLLPSTEKAGKLFDQIERVAGKVPIDVNGPGTAAMKIQEVAQSGATMPKVVRDFLNRVTRPNAQPLTYAEARKFYENATRLSFDEMNRLTPKAKYMVGQFTRSLDRAIQDAAQQVGMGQQYAKAMSAYNRAAEFQRFTHKTLPKVAAAGATAGGAGWLAHYLRGNK